MLKFGVKLRESGKIADFYGHINLVACCFEVIKTVYSIIPVDKVRAQWIVQGVRKWNVPFENATVAKLLNILTGTDVF